eukprot:m.151699 g.151699  ORF g.151699 m.151699 type:complete len:75 (-) comp14256_c0_seq1:392-616(-)
MSIARGGGLRHCPVQMRENKLGVKWIHDGMCISVCAAASQAVRVPRDTIFLFISFETYPTAVVVPPALTFHFVS